MKRYYFILFLSLVMAAYGQEAEAPEEIAV